MGETDLNDAKGAKMVSQIGQNEGAETVDAVLANHTALLGRYRLKRCLGEGGQGKMLLAEDERGESVAIKAYDIARMPNWKATELFEREMSTMQELDVEGVPRCIELIDASDMTPPYYFIVQAFVPGQSLQDRMVPGYRFELKIVIDIMAQIVRILRVLSHQRPAVIHRDVKPSNIMLTPQGKVYLVDFGASVRSTAQFGGSTFAGTAGYMAPEQTLGDASPASDVYGLGATMIHLVCGKAPYEMPHRGLVFDFRQDLPNNVPPWLVSLMESMVQPQPAMRPSVPQIAMILESADLVAVPVAAMPVLPAPQANRRSFDITKDAAFKTAQALVESRHNEREKVKFLCTRGQMYYEVVMVATAYAVMLWGVLWNNELHGWMWIFLLAMGAHFYTRYKKAEFLD